MTIAMPPDYASHVIGAVAASLLFALIFMPCIIWANRRVFGRNPWFEGLMWGTYVLAPTLEAFINPVCEAIVK